MSPRVARNLVAVALSMLPSLSPAEPLDSFGKARLGMSASDFRQVYPSTQCQESALRGANGSCALQVTFPPYNLQGPLIGLFSEGKLTALNFSASGRNDQYAEAFLYYSSVLTSRLGAATLQQNLATGNRTIQRLIWIGDRSASVRYEWEGAMGQATLQVAIYTKSTFDPFAMIAPLP